MQIRQILHSPKLQKTLQAKRAPGWMIPEVALRGGGEPTLQRLSADLDFKALALQIFKAIDGPGTDPRCIAERSTCLAGCRP